MVGGAAPLAGDFKAIPRLGNAGVDHQTREGRSDAENPLGRGVVEPAGRAGQPGVAGLPMAAVVLTHDELAKRLARTGQTMVKQKFSIDTMVDGNINVYRRILGDY